MKPISHSYFIGIDIGTSSTKSILITEEGDIVSFGEARYLADAPAQDRAEQDPEVWRQAVAHSVRALLRDAPEARKRIAGVALTGQMHGLVMLDRQHRVLAPAILWSDRRSSEEKDALNRYLEQRGEETGGPIAEGFLLPSLLWVQRHRSDLVEQIRTVLTPKDYLRLHLTGVAAMDPTDASGTGAYAAARGTWHTDMLGAFGIERDWFPPILPSLHQAGRLRAAAAAELGLEAGIPVIAGCGDLQASALGSGIVTPRQLLVNVGSGGQVLQLLSDYKSDSQGSLYTMPYVDGRSFHQMGSILAAGLSIRWIADLLSVTDDAAFADMLGRVDDLCACEQGLFFHPYLNGDRTPDRVGRLTASFVGITSSHRGPDLFRAVLEGVAFSLRACYAALSVHAERPEAVRIGGRIFQTPHYRRIIADMFGLPVEYPEQPHTGAFGAALLALSGTTGRELAEVASRSVRLAGVTLPDASRAQLYAERLDAFHRLTPPSAS